MNNTKKGYYLLTSFIFLLVSTSCAVSRHNIAGTTYGWSQSGFEVLSDVQVSGLQVRHVKNNNQKCVRGAYEHLELNGPIGPDSTFVVEEFLRKINKCTNDEAGNWISTSVYLNSDGGLVEHGFALGLLFKKYQVVAIITGEQYCASSCAIAFLGAKYRYMYSDGKLLFHAPYIYDANGISCSNQELKDKIRQYYVEFLGENEGERLYDRTMSYCSDSNGWLLNKDAARIYGLLTPEPN